MRGPDLLTGELHPFFPKSDHLNQHDPSACIGPPRFSVQRATLRRLSVADKLVSSGGRNPESGARDHPVSLSRNAAHHQGRASGREAAAGAARSAEAGAAARVRRGWQVRGRQMPVPMSVRRPKYWVWPRSWPLIALSDGLKHPQPLHVQMHEGDRDEHHFVGIDCHKCRDLLAGIR